MSIDANLKQIEARIQAACERCHRNRREITLVGVSKKQPVAAIKEALQTTPLRDFGENYVQEYVNKRREIDDPNAQFHFIGHLQKNKVRQLMAFPPTLIHSVDSPDLARQINKVSAEVAPDDRQKILIELRIGDEDSEKTGVELQDLPNLIQTIDECRHLHCVGLMIIPPFSENPEDSRPYFKKVREIFNDINQKRTEKLTVLSYGMSADFEIAIEEGATHIRVGTALFGARRA